MVQSTAVSMVDSMEPHWVVMSDDRLADRLDDPMAACWAESTVAHSVQTWVVPMDVTLVPLMAV